MDRRLAMLASDSVAALSTLVIAVLALLDRLHLWSIVPLLTITSACEAFQSLAYAASISLLVPKSRLGHVNGLVQLGQAVPRVIGPVLAGGLLETVGLRGVILLDLASYLIAVTTLVRARIPRPQATGREVDGRSSLLQEIAQGWHYLRARAGLLGMLALLAVCYFSIGLVNVAGQPLVLSFTSPATLGTILSVAGIGFVVGGLVMSAWGGPKRLIHGVLGLPFRSASASCCRACVHPRY